MKVALLLSGGVDSSVALHLLREDGHQVTAYYLKIWLEDELAHLGDCPWEEDLVSARAVCERFDVPLEVVSFQAQYRETVVSRVLEELRRGRTPSPDILCNRDVKFGAFVDYLTTHSDDSTTAFERVASGHYARIEHHPDGTIDLLKGVDPVKDQTYFLHALSHSQLATCLFPLGGLTKREVRVVASTLQLPNHDRPDSQGICFLGKIPYDQFVRGYLGDNPGEIVDSNSRRVLGTHRGLWFHTIGQRRGLGLSGGPWYVVDKDREANRVLVTHASDLPRFARTAFAVSSINWLKQPSQSRLSVRIRHSPECPSCVIEERPDGDLAVELGAPDSGIAEGQAAVFYDGDVCLGGGQIQGPIPSFA